MPPRNKSARERISRDFVRWLRHDGAPSGSQTFTTLRACRSYARRALLHHPTWIAQLVRHEGGGEQVVVAEISR